MKKVFITLFLILAINANAQDTKFITKASNGLVSEIGFITSDGKKDSTWVRYNEAGIIIGIAQYNNDCKHGTWQIFNDNGVKLFEIVYVDGIKKSGKHWNDNGILIEEKLY